MCNRCLCRTGIGDSGIFGGQGLIQLLFGNVLLFGQTGVTPVGGLGFNGLCAGSGRLRPCRFGAGTLFHAAQTQQDLAGTHAVIHIHQNGCYTAGCLRGQVGLLHGFNDAIPSTTGTRVTGLWRDGLDAP